ncbi:LytR/AlgR family response regulator transcription factor [Flavobacterium subsaxonicum]|uniref:Chemotaxis protein CheY n=1 Tax=Flavobacterium subsaxonicum WB 4.1-42 = DSM 21790 TaxID=1121898 RepID=A0A0A2MMR9_9FLAO|nr:LytTR family DNA-binding domain-containing protein [Flavobacterium subsaxonicum]KGO92753.1 chemotaxis protein CheY [Flavobacterium subsaxonicum WB 4.1-42 = DSM 21790]
MLTKIKCIIVDDEPMALNLLESYVQKTPFLELVKKCSNGFEALEAINGGNVQLAFLDIQMPELSGLELSKTLPKTTRVIFTTAFNEYALDGFKAEALDYLMKPFGFDEFYNAATRAKEWFALVNNQGQAAPAATAVAAPAPAKQDKEFIFVKSEYKQLKIKLSEVLYFEGLKDYIKIWIEGNPKPILTLMSMKALEEDLPADKFMRIHRSFIVSLDKVETIERNQVIINKERITVADQYKAAFKEFIKDNSID